jgi:hypothetical protein
MEVNMAVPVHIVLIDTTGTIRFSRMQKVAAAIEHQVKHDLGKFYDVEARINALRHGEELPNKTWPVHIVPDVHGGGGFHSDQEGAPFAKVCIGPHWTMSVSHEIIEMIFDPTGSRLHTAPAIHLVDGQVENTEGEFRYLMEICDPCESADCAYKIDDVVVSDFYTPDYFDLHAKNGVRYSFNGGITAPRQVPKGGYLCWLNPRLDKMQMLRNLDRDPEPRIHTFDQGRPKRKSLREFVDGKFQSMHRLAVASWDHPIFHDKR